MTDTAASPLQELTSSATEYQALQFLILQRLIRVQTSILVRVEAVHGGGVAPVGTVDVLPLVNQVDGAGNSVQHQTIYGLPYVRIQGGGSALIIDPVKGDLGLACFCSRDISAVKSAAASGGALPVNPASGRIFAYPDGIYVGGALNQTATEYIQCTGSGINIVSPGPVTINGAVISAAGEVTNAAGIVLGTHEHTPGTYEAGGDPVSGLSGEAQPVSAPFATLLLDLDNWDLVLDSNANIAVATYPYSLTQDVASAIKTFSGEVWYDDTLGVDYFGTILGKTPPLAVFQQQMVSAALTVPFVASAQCIIESFMDRQVTGQVPFIDQNHTQQSVSI